MNDGIKEIGKYMKETGSKTAHALDRHRKNIPIVQRLRDVFDSTQSFDAAFNTTPTDRVRMTLYFTPGLPALIGNQNNCGDCYCNNRDDFVGGLTDYVTTYEPVSNLRVYINGVRTTNISQAGSTVSVLDVTVSTDTVSIRYVYKYAGNCGSGTPPEDDCTDTGIEIAYFTKYNLRYSVGTNLGEYLDEVSVLQPVEEGYTFAPQDYLPGAGKAQGDLEASTPSAATSAPYSYKEYRSVIIYALDEFTVGTARAVGRLTFIADDLNDLTPKDTGGASYTYRISTTVWDTLDAAEGWNPTGPVIAEGTISVPMTNTVYEVPLDVQFSYDSIANGEIQLHVQVVDMTYGVISTGGAAFHQDFVVGDTSSPGSPFIGPQVRFRFIPVDGFHTEVPILYTQACSCQPESDLDGNLWTLGYQNGTLDETGYFISGPETPNQAKARVGRAQIPSGEINSPPFTFQDIRQIIEYELPEGTTHIRFAGKIIDDAIGFNESDPPAGPDTPPGYSTHYRIATTTWEDHNDPLASGGWEPNGEILFEGDIPVTYIRQRDNGVLFDITLPVSAGQEIFSIHISSINDTGITLVSQDDYVTSFIIQEYTFVDGDGAAPGLSIGQWQGAFAGVFVGTSNSRIGDESTTWPSLIAFAGCNGDVPPTEPPPDTPPPDPDDPADDTGGPGGGGGGGGPAPDLPPIEEDDYTFGGDPTGATNVQSQLQSFLNGVPNGSTVGFVANAIYRLDSGRILLDNRHDLTFVGRGCTWDRTYRGTDSIFLINNGSSNIRLDSMTIKGRNPNPGGWDINYEHEHGIELGGVINFNANNVTIKNVNGDGIYVSGSIGANTWSRNVRFHHGVFDGIGRMGVAVTDGGEDVTIDFNLFKNIGYYTWDIEPNGAIVAGELAGGRRVKFNDNDITIEPYGDFPDDPDEALGYLFAATGASGGGPADDVEIGRNRITGGAMRIYSFSGGSRTNFNIHDNVSTFSFVSNGHINTVIGLPNVDGVRITDNTQPLTNGTFTNTSGSSNVVISGNSTP